MAPKKKTRRELPKKNVAATTTATTTTTTTTTVSLNDKKKKRNNPNDEVSGGSSVESPKLLNGTMKAKRPKQTYPRRLMVNFKRLDYSSLKRYAEFYHLGLKDDASTQELVTAVARHFDSSLEVDEEDSICSFVRRIRNGDFVDKSCRNETSRKRERKDVKKRSKKSNSSRKRKEDTFEQADRPPDEEDISLYCICNRPSFGDMIACDGETCPKPTQWYHLSCVGLSPGAHPDIWLCPDCHPNSGDSTDEKKRSFNSRSSSPGHIRK